MQLLHNRFSHPSKYVLQKIMKSLLLHSNHSQSLEFCDACQCVKLHQFHFLVTDIKSKYPLQLLYVDLWGPTSVFLSWMVINITFLLLMILQGIIGYSHSRSNQKH